MARIVVGVDGSEQSVAALRWAVPAGQRWGARVEAATACVHPVSAEGVSSYEGRSDARGASARDALGESLRHAFPDDPDRGGVERVVFLGGAAHPEA
jgi:predicted RNA polymerase sigma factor